MSYGQYQDKSKTNQKQKPHLFFIDELLAVLKVLVAQMGECHQNKTLNPIAMQQTATYGLSLSPETT